MHVFVLAALLAPVLLSGFVPVLRVVTPSGHEHHSHLHLPGSNADVSLDSQASGEFSGHAFLVAIVSAATAIGLVLAVMGC